MFYVAVVFTIAFLKKNPSDINSHDKSTTDVNTLTECISICLYFH